MATVIVQAVASLDGFIARPDDLPGPIFDWYQAGDAELRFDPDDVFHVSSSPKDYLKGIDPRCQVIGRHLFDITDGWGGLPIVGDRVFVVTHRDARRVAGAPSGGAVHVRRGVAEEAVRRRASTSGTER